MSTATPVVATSSPPGLDPLTERVHYLVKWFLADAFITALCALGIVCLSSTWQHAGHEVQWGSIWPDWQRLEGNRKSARDQLLTWGAFVPALLALPTLSSVSGTGHESIAQRAAQIIMQRVVAVVCLSVSVGALLLIPTKREALESKTAVYPTGSLVLCLFTWLLCSALFVCLNTPAGQRSRLLARAVNRRNAIAALLGGNTGADPMRIRASLAYAWCFVRWHTPVGAIAITAPTLCAISAWTSVMTYVVVMFLIMATIALLASGTAIYAQRRWRRSYEGRFSGVMNIAFYLLPASLILLFLLTLPTSKHGILGFLSTAAWILLCLFLYEFHVKRQRATYRVAQRHLWSKDLHFAEQSVTFQKEQAQLETPTTVAPSNNAQACSHSSPPQTTR